MRHATTLAALLLGLVPAALAQSDTVPVLRDHGSGLVPHRHVTYVAPSMAYHPGPVEVRGWGLDLITAARLDGVEIPILARGDRRLVLSVPSHDPGFGALELVRPADAMQARMEFLPSLRARWDGGLVQFRLNPGESGWYILSYSFRLHNEMRIFAGTEYGLWLDLGAAQSGTLFSGLSTAEPMDFPWMPVPRGLFGPGGIASTRPMHVQGFVGMGSEVCFTNLVTLQPTL